MRMASSVTILVACLSLWTAAHGEQAQHKVIRYGQEEIDQVLSMHNDLRRSVRGAANMMKLVREFTVYVYDNHNDFCFLFFLL